MRLLVLLLALVLTINGCIHAPCSCLSDLHCSMLRPAPKDGYYWKCYGRGCDERELRPTTTGPTRSTTQPTTSTGRDNSCSISEDCWKKFSPPKHGNWVCRYGHCDLPRPNEYL